jgi:hypothetical protein
MAKISPEKHNFRLSCATMSIKDGAKKVGLSESAWISWLNNNLGKACKKGKTKRVVLTDADLPRYRHNDNTNFTPSGGCGIFG